MLKGTNLVERNKILESTANQERKRERVNKRRRRRRRRKCESLGCERYKLIKTFERFFWELIN